MEELNTSKSELNMNLVRKVILFFSTLFAVSFSMAVDFSSGSSFNDWIVYWTHLSCLMVLVWSFFSLVVEFTRDDKIGKIVNSWYLKGLTTISIVVTGSVFFIFGLGPVLYIGITKNKPEIIFSTIFLHIVTPLLMIWEFGENPSFTETRIEQTNKQKISIIFIVPAMYFVFVMLLMSKGAKPPYPIFAFLNSNKLPEIIQSNEVALYFWYVFSLVAVICVVLWFIFVAKVCLTWENRKEIKSEKMIKKTKKQKKN